MGYRSEVLVCVPETDFFKASDEIKLWLKNCDEVYKCNLGDREEIGLVFRWDYVKWYSGYKDVDAIESWVHTLASENCQAGILRIGEDEEDIERKGNLFDYPIGVLTSAYIDELDPYNVQFPEEKEAI